jgi:radical SAM protein with 4Fe4S-binding SPASM domain
MFLRVNPRWSTRLETFGGLAHYLHGHARLLALNAGAAALVELLRRRPRRRADLLRAFPEQAGPVVDQLVERGVLVASPSEETAQGVDRSELDEIIRLIDAQPKSFLSAPAEINLYTTLRCNINCEFCYLSPETRRTYGPPRMELAVLDALLRDAVQERVFSINFLGGEPFVDARSMEHALTRFGDGLAFVVTTNGTIRPSPEMLKLLRQDTVTVQFSIHSMNPAVHDELTGSPGAWERAWANLTLLCDAGVDVFVQLVLSRLATREDVLTLCRTARQVGARGMSINNVFPGSHMSLSESLEYGMPPDRVGPLALELNRIRADLGDDFYVFHKGTYAFVHEGVTPPRESDLDDFLTQPGDGVTSLEILSDGAVFAGSADLNGAGRPVGHLGRSSLRSIWHSPALHQVRGLARTLHEPCASCPHRSFCKGGNPQISLQTVGRPSGGDIRCPRVWHHLQRAIAGSRRGEVIA